MYSIQVVLFNLFTPAYPNPLSRHVFISILRYTYGCITNLNHIITG